MDFATVFVDIESLLDLRQGYYASKPEMSRDEVFSYLISEEFNFRESDNLRFLEPGEFQTAMKDPSLRILDGSVVTYVLSMVKNHIDRIEVRNKFNNEHRVGRVILNVYPFKMTEAQMEHIRTLLFIKLGKNTMTHVTYMKPEEIDPGFIKSSVIVAAYLYNASEWLKVNMEKLTNQPLNDTFFFFPALYPTIPTDAERKAISKAGFADAFSYMEFLYASFAPIKFLPVAFYSNFVTATKYFDEFLVEAKKELAETAKEEEANCDDLIPEVQVP